MFHIDKVLKNAKVSDDHKYIGEDDDGNVIEALSSVTNIINPLNYSNDHIKASADISNEIHSVMAQIMHGAHYHTKKSWHEKRYGAHIPDRVINYLVTEMMKYRETSQLLYNLLGHVVSIMNGFFRAKNQYITFITEKPMIAEFVFHDSGPFMSLHNLQKEENEHLVLGRDYIGGTPDLIIVAHDTERDILSPENLESRNYSYAIIDYKNVTQDKFSNWQMQLFIYHNMFEAVLRSIGARGYCLGLFICNSVEKQYLKVHTWNKENIIALQKKFRDSYLARFKTRELSLSLEILDEIKDLAIESQELKERERAFKKDIANAKCALKEKTSALIDKINSAGGTELPFRYSSDEATIVKTANYRTIVEFDDPNHVSVFKNTKFKGYTTKIVCSFGVIDFSDGVEDEQ